MSKHFNTEGTCIPKKHFMVDISPKLEEIFQLVERGDYFTINRPRQYGKTTTLFLLHRFLEGQEEYLPIKISFGGMDSSRYENAGNFSHSFLSALQHFLAVKGNQELADWVEQTPKIKNFSQLNQIISQLVQKSGKRVVLLIDEVDYAGNFSIFLRFLGLLRQKYLMAEEDSDTTFHSVILAGLQDVKNLNAKIWPEDQQEFNSPWNIAIDFKVDLSFSAKEIESMLNDYAQEKKVELDISMMAERLHFYTSGYPFLVSRLCKIMDEDLMENNTWDNALLEEAVQQILGQQHTNFESLITNLENNSTLYQLTHDCLISGIDLTLNLDNPEIQRGIMYGVFHGQGKKLRIHNRIYEQRIYNYMTSKMETSGYANPHVSARFVSSEGTLQFENVLKGFQSFMKEQYSKKDADFLERNGRLIFLAFLSPIINGHGHAFKEIEISEERRLDVTVTYREKKYVVELKIWRGSTAHQQGIQQLADYLERTGLNEGFLVIFDPRKTQQGQMEQQSIEFAGKQIFMIWV